MLITTVQFEMKISRASPKNYSQKNFSQKTLSVYQFRTILSRKTKGKGEKRRGQCLVHEDTSIPPLENVNHSEIPKQPQLNPLRW